MALATLGALCSLGHLGHLTLGTLETLGTLGALWTLGTWNIWHASLGGLVRQGRQSLWLSCMPNSASWQEADVVADNAVGARPNPCESHNPAA